MARKKTPELSGEDALLRAVADNPADDLPRLVYCDWLEERQKDLDRAAFIRWQLNTPHYNLTPVSLKVFGPYRTPGGRYREAAKITDCINSTPWVETKVTRYFMPAQYVGDSGPRVQPGRSVVVSNPGRSCLVVWRRGFVAAACASYVNLTLPVIRLLQKQPLEILHWYGDIPGSSQIVSSVAAGRDPHHWQHHMLYRWHDFKTELTFTSVGDMYQPGGYTYTSDFQRYRMGGVRDAFDRALQYYFPNLRGFREARPTADDVLIYQRYFHPGAGCATPFSGIGSVRIGDPGGARPAAEDDDDDA